MPAPKKEAVTMQRGKSPFAPPTIEEIARRKALVAQILAKRKGRHIAPLTSADLVRKARNWETQASPK